MFPNIVFSSRGGVGRSRFNLIELVVVITIFTGLLSLLIPVVLRFRVNAKTVLCSKNLHRIGVWTRMYCASNDGVFPAYEDGWVMKLGQMSKLHVRQKQAPEGIFSCPSQPLESFSEGIDPADYWRGTHYGLNQHIASRLFMPDKETRYPQWTQVKISDFHSAPDRKVIMADASGSNYFLIPNRDPVIAGISMEGKSWVDSLRRKTQGPARPFPYLRHSEGAGNFVFADGHVDSLESFPGFVNGHGTDGYYFWHGQHEYWKRGY